jgi:hypothetical protein
LMGSFTHRLNMYISLTADKEFTKDSAVNFC